MSSWEIGRITFLLLSSCIASISILSLLTRIFWQYGNEIARLKEYEDLEKRLIALEQKAKKSWALSKAA